LTDKTERQESSERRRRPWEMLLGLFWLILAIAERHWWLVAVGLVLVALNVPGLVRDIEAVRARRRENPPSLKDKRKFRQDVLIGVVIIVFFVVVGAVQQANWWLFSIAVVGLSASALLLWRNLRRSEG
jgi:Na+/H+ antiporter NhaD/arsenite permease-like protein